MCYQLSVINEYMKSEVIAVLKSYHYNVKNDMQLYAV